MVLPNVTLFPQALLPLYIFEPRYRRMLADALATQRLLAVAMRRPNRQRESASPVAGVGLVRISVEHPDGTSHLILQGVARVTLVETVRRRPYRVMQIQPLAAPPCDTLAADALLARLRELLHERFALGLPLPLPPLAQSHPGKLPSALAKEVLGYLDTIADPEQAVDLVSSAVLPNPTERQAMLETVDVESRLRRLNHLLLEEIRRHRENHHE